MIGRDLRQEWHRATARPWLLTGEMESGEMESVVLSGRSQRHGGGVCVRERNEWQQRDLTEGLAVAVVVVF